MEGHAGTAVQFRTADGYVMQIAYGSSNHPGRRDYSNIANELNDDLDHWQDTKGVTLDTKQPDPMGGVMDALPFILIAAAVIAVVVFLVRKFSQGKVHTVTTGSGAVMKTQTPEPAVQPVQFCPYCGAQVHPGASFCSKCGSKIVQQ